MDAGMGNARIDVGVFGAEHDGGVNSLLATRVSRLDDLLFLRFRRVPFTTTILFRRHFRRNFSRAIGVAEQYSEIDSRGKGTDDMSIVETTRKGILARFHGDIRIISGFFTTRIR